MVGKVEGLFTCTEMLSDNKIWYFLQVSYVKRC